MRVRGLILPWEVQPNITSSVVVHACSGRANTITGNSTSACLCDPFLRSWQRRSAACCQIGNSWCAWIGIYYLGMIAWVICLFHCKQCRRSASSSLLLQRWLWLCCMLKDRNASVSCYAAALFLFILSDADYMKITAVLLKSRTGEFDLESILFLKLRGLGKIALIYHCLSLLRCMIASNG